MLDVALVGFGWWGQHIAKRLRDHAGFNLLIVVEPMLSAHDAVRDMGLTPVGSYAEALDSGATAIILTSPNDQHDTQVAQAIAAGKHVFCEKPLSLTAAGANASVSAAHAAGLVLGVGHERRFEPAILELRAMLDRRELGTIMHAELAFSHDKLKDLPAGSWRTSKAMAPAAGMTQMGIHLTDLLISFFGRVKTVQAFTADRSLGWETGDLVSVHLQFEDGMTAHLQAILHTPHYIRTAIFGSEMRVEVLNATHPDTPGGKVTMECYNVLIHYNVTANETLMYLYLAKTICIYT
jgi:predicted dehydrogenase